MPSPDSPLYLNETQDKRALEELDTQLRRLKMALSLLKNVDLDNASNVIRLPDQKLETTHSIIKDAISAYARHRRLVLYRLNPEKYTTEER